MKKLIISLMATLIPVRVMANPACPVCTVAIGAALPITRRMGLPDAVAGIWVGAFLAIMGYWIIKFMDRRHWNFPGRNALVLILSVATIGFAYINQVEYSPCFLGIDPLLFGTILGALLFIGTEKLYDWMKQKNGGHAHFPFEKVVLPLVVLTLASIILFKCA
ncbi:hypothetical protein HDR63_04055 [bacterium]|nr:hypothetical protein [bacterium]